MNPIKLSLQLQDTLVSYLTTTFDVNRDGQEPALASFLQRSFSKPHSLFAGPYLELTPPYKTSETLEELVAQGILSPKLLQMQCFREGRPLPIDMPLYTHQAKSMRKLCSEGRNIVVSSGTGSGKTECFLIPILNDLLVDPTPGVRAVLVYPLNALVNDQLDRLRVLLRGTDITFGRYTSELENNAGRARKQMEKDWEEMEPSRKAIFDQYPLPNEIIGRDQIQNDGMLPQILITNYAMLEYLLLRPQDHPLFATGKWRFAILDEAHSYAGAQGIEVGLLMRRLKLRLGHQPGQVRCVATSATLTDDDADDARQFAGALFGEEFEVDDIIFGELDHDYIPPAASRAPSVPAYIHPRFDELIENIRQEEWKSTDEMALLMHEIGLINDEDLHFAEECDPPRFLWEVLRGNADLAKLRDFMTEAGRPIEVTAVSEELFHARLPSEQRENALYHLIELAAMARPDIDKPSLLPARYHLFVRPPQGVWACINPICSDKQSDNLWSKLYATPRETCETCQAPVFPLVICRTCGQVYLRLHKVGKEYQLESAMQDEAEVHYVTLRPIRENRALATEDEDDEESLVDQAGESVLKQEEIMVCLTCSQAVRNSGKCGCQQKSDTVVSLYLLKRESPVKRGGKEGTREEIVHHMGECGRCHSTAFKGTEIATEITLNALTPLTVLTEDLYRSLPESPNLDAKKKPGGGRKLLSFYDSRQGAARFAAFVQDIVNRQAYRRIMAEAAANVSTETYLPDLERMGEICLDLALQYRVVHNDPEISKGDLPRNVQYLNQSQKERVMRYLRKQLFAEITTQLRSRQALESLGLLSVQYFEPGKEPDFGILAESLNMTVSETQALVEYLLDDLRRAKVVTLPEGVQRDDPIFGRNKFSPRLVRGEASQYEIAWIGKTPRHSRRQLMRKILRYKGLPHDEQSTILAMENILIWLINRTDILDTSRHSDGYQVRHDRLFFQANSKWYRCDQCQRLNNRGQALPCPHPHCEGSYQPVDIADLRGKNFFYDNLRQELVPMRVEEHTAQLDPAKGRDYQNQFKAGNINMLSCSTTFEMGIDLGDLQAVVMSNIPPTVANYKQRAGRAGRRTSGTAFILAWASNRPHDQAYFKSPAEIIGGRVRVPFINVHNPIIIQRHVNAVLLSEFLRQCASLGEFNKSVAGFFDEQSVTGHYFMHLNEWMNDNEEWHLGLLERYSRTVNQAINPQQALRAFIQNLRNKGQENYQTVTGYYKGALQELALRHYDLIMQNEMGNVISIGEEIQHFKKLLDRVQEEDLINYLSDRGVLPSYSFPLHVVELRIPPHLLPAKELRLQRNLQLAIREYAPGQEVVADKRIWKSDALDFFGKEPQIFAYHICPNCNYLRLMETPGMPLEESTQPCPVCHEPTTARGRKHYQYIQPDGFRVSSDSGKPAGQYVDRPFNLMRSALVPGPVDAEPISQVLSIGYDRSGALLYVNEGMNGLGFKICLKCGRNLRSNARSCTGIYNGQPCPGKLDRNATYTLGFKQDTDTLHLKFSSTGHIILPNPDNMSFWLSLKYALLQGAGRALQIERTDIDGVLFPEPLGQDWRQSIVLFDNVPGGAGHVKRIQDEISQVVAAALEIVDCKCEKSCYRCLREYSNQWEHHLLDRVPVETFLRALDSDLQRTVQGDTSGLYPVAAVNQAAWLWENLQRAEVEVILFAEQITQGSPIVEGTTWFDLIQELLLRGVNVRLIVNHLPDQFSGHGESLIGASHLRMLLRRGLDLRQTNRHLPWIAVIDPNGTTPIAVRASEELAVGLSTQIEEQLLATSHSAAVAEIWLTMENFQVRSVEHSELREPENTIVYEIIPDGKQQHTEAEFFSEFYSKPVVGMVVSDRFLNTGHRILDRLGSHIKLAQESNDLKWVVVKTRSKQGDQEQAIKDLQGRFPDVEIEFKLDNHTDHDRYIEVTRSDGGKSRAIIGFGLDFIQQNGGLVKTFLIFQSEYGN